VTRCIIGFRTHLLVDLTGLIENWLDPSCNRLIDDKQTGQANKTIETNGASDSAS
jgi:hypothetical protein